MLARWSSLVFATCGCVASSLGVSPSLAQGLEVIFLPHSDYAAGVNPWSVAIGDLNGDARQDLVVANTGSGTASVYLGNGDGSFGLKTDFPVGSTPLAVAIGDFNADSKPDVVAANYVASATVSVLLGNGDGTLAAKSDFATGNSPSHVAIADFNGDSRPDLVTTSYQASGYVSVLLGAAAGNFGSPTNLAAGSRPLWVAVADLNADGKLDLVTANSSSANVSVLLGNGDGTFAPQKQFPAATGARSVAIGDLDGDGIPDLAVANQTTATVTIHVGDGTGEFNPGAAYPTGSDPRSIAIGDFNLDGRLDLVVSNFGSSTVTVYLGYGNGTFASGVTFSTLANPVTVAVADLNGDGKPDLATANASGSISVLLNLTSTGSPTNVSLTTSPNPSFEGETVTLTAKVSPSDATGSVTFFEGPTPLGVSPLVGDSASLAIGTLFKGSHLLQAVYGGDSFYAASASPTVTQVVNRPPPTLVGVRDVPNDQGGRVFVTWRYLLDQPGATIITRYRIWRRVPPAQAMMAGPRSGEGALSAVDPIGAVRMLWRRSPAGRAEETFWEAIAELPAANLISYGYTAATTQDSMAGSNPYTAFFVQALTSSSNPFDFYNSAPDSGYSVDNLAPPVPAPFVATYLGNANSLHWGTSRAPDLREFRLHRGTSPDFTPGPGNLVVATRDTGCVDAPGAVYYKLAAVDLHGNLSRYALVSPEAPTAALASLVRVEAGAERIRLTWYAAGNPGLAATVYRRALVGDWVALASLVADGSGYIRYEDTAISEGTRYGYRLGIMDGGVEAFAGETWVTAERPAFALLGARPNPARAGAFSVAFVLADDGPAVLEVLDVGGRRLVGREVGALGPGPHALNLGADRRLPPGIYLVRLRQGGIERVVRAAVID